MHATTVSTGRYGTSFSREEGHHRCERRHLVTRTAALAFRSRIPPVLLGRGSRPDTGVDLGSGSCSADSRGPAAQPVIASAGELAPLVRGTARAHSRGSVFMALPPGPRRRGSKPGLLVATSMGSALEGVAIRGEWPHIAVTRVRPPSRTTLLPGCGNGPKNGPKTPYGAYRAILVPVRFRGADLLGVSGSVEHPGRIVLTSLSLRPVYLPQR